MTKKTRLIIFSIFVVLYLVIAPLIIFYSLGYRFDFEKRKIISTGGLYLKFWPENAEVFVDGKLKKKLNPLSSERLIQGLFPKKHTILVKKDGYNQWEKTLEVKEKEVNRVENVILIKEKIIFEKLKEDIKDFYLSPKGDLILLLDSSGYNFLINDVKTMTEKNSFSLAKTAKDNINIVSWDENLKKIILKTESNYFSVDYNKSGAIEPKITLLGDNKELVSNGKLIFEKRRGYIYLLNTKTNEFDNFYQAKDIIFSPNKSRFLFFNDHEILFADTNKLDEKILLFRFSEKINDCLWLNNNYLIFDVAGRIKITEIDNRDKINIVEIPQQIYLNDGSIAELKNPKILFNQTDKKLYILTENTIFVSEKLLP